MGNLKGKCALVTGGGQGLGYAIVEHLLDAGADVAVHYFSSETGARELKSLAEKKGRRAEIFHADLTKEAEATSLVNNAANFLGGLDVLVNNAGIAGPAAPVEEMDDGSWRRTLDVNLTGAFLCSKFAVPMIKDAGGGSIVFMSSNAGTMGLPFRGPYVASKWGLIGFTKSLAMELGPHNIRVNAICPGDVEGERIDRVIAAEARNRGTSENQVIAERVAAVSLRTMVTADDVAALILFVCSEAGAKISGQALVVDGNAERA
jgi:NAD(P)-dependent dehydrogenase (short-subunit alcohol dehydrogenase family)